MSFLQNPRPWFRAFPNPPEVSSCITLIKEYPEIKEASVAGPGFINLTFNDSFLIDFMNESNENININYNLDINKKIFLCSTTEEDFNILNTVAFYELPKIIQLVGNADDNVKKIIELQ